MNFHLILLLLSSALLATMCALFVLGFFMVKRHRSLFKILLDIQKRYDGELDRISVQTRKDVLKLAFRLDYPGTLPVVPFDLRSQDGEDTFLYDFFRGRDQGFFIEAGAYDGKVFSNTYFLESIGWQGLLVEAHPSLYAKCRINRPNSTVVHCALGAIDGGEIEFTCADMKDAFGLVSFVEADESHVKRCLDEGHSLSKVRVPRRSLDGLLEPLTAKVDLLSLDIEGMELQALQGFNIAKYQPEVIIVESNDAKGGLKVLTYLAEFSYLPTKKIGSNTFYIKGGHSERFGGEES